MRKIKYTYEDLIAKCDTHTKAELATMFGVSQSTIYRDLVKLKRTPKGGKVGRPKKLQERS